MATSMNPIPPDSGAATRKGSVEEFDRNWKLRSETKYNHWTKGTPANQIQLAFRCHWQLFREILEGRPMVTALEVGSGRGSLSSYFADNRIQCTLLDTSAAILEFAESIFAANGHKAEFVQGNALALPFADESFDIVASIGLLEHFEDIRSPILEQVRVLKRGGTFFGYIVPERPENIQRYFRWVNAIMKFVASISASQKAKESKSEIFRSDLGSDRYVEVLKEAGINDVLVTGVYPLPMISHSPEFPFSLLPAPLEYALTRIFMGVLSGRKVLFGKNPWMCREEFGQAFLVSFQKI